ncbi:MAG: hypothetical protein AAGG59_03040 [Bacteroidota bacterium]
MDYTKLIVCLLLSSMLLESYSQKSTGQLTIMDANVDPGGIINELPLAPPSTVGSTYIHEDWRSGELTLKNGTKISGYNLRYDLESDGLEIRYEEEIKICPYVMIDEFTISNPESNLDMEFVNTKKLNLVSSDGLSNIVQVLSKNEETLLLKSYNISVKESTYVPALDMGDNENKIQVKSKYYFVVKNEVNLLDKRLKKNKDLFASRYSDIEEFVKSKKLKLNNDSDVVMLFSYYSGL